MRIRVRQDRCQSRADCGCSVCHNACSGLRLGSRITPVNAMVAKGIPVAYGINPWNILGDRNMTVEMKLVWALHRDTGLVNDRLEAAQVRQPATEHGAARVGFKGGVGGLDRPFVDPRTPVVDTVLLRLTKIDRDAVMGEIHDRMSAPETMQEAHNRAMVDALFPQIESDLRASVLGKGYRPYRFNQLSEL